MQHVEQVVLQDDEAGTAGDVHIQQLDKNECDWEHTEVGQGREPEERCRNIAAQEDTQQEREGSHKGIPH